MNTKAFSCLATTGLIMALLCGCTSPQQSTQKGVQAAAISTNWSKLQKGMTEGQVAALIGPLSKMAHTPGAGYSPETGKGFYISRYDNDTCSLVFIDDRLSSWTLR